MRVADKLSSRVTILCADSKPEDTVCHIDPICSKSKNCSNDTGNKSTDLNVSSLLRQTAK